MTTQHGVSSWLAHGCDMNVTVEPWARIEEERQRQAVAVNGLMEEVRRLGATQTGTQPELERL